MVPTPTRIRKLKPGESFYEIAQSQYKCMITCYWLVLEAKNEVSEEQIEEALRILFRNIDILNMRIQNDNGDYWFYKMDSERIPLEVLRNQSADDVFHNQMQTSIDSATGPLWRAKYIIKDKPVDNNFTSDIIFTFNHAVSDGFTAFNICNSFLKVLNDVIGGRVQASYNFGELDDGHETEELMAKRTEYFNENPEHYKEIQTILDEFQNLKVRFNEFFPVPEGTPKITKHIHREIDEETNKKILKVLKSKGLSFHSGFTAVANWALMELLTENGLSDEAINLVTFHMINLRRYWKKSSSIRLGPHVSPMRILSHTDKNVGANLWQYAREFNGAMRSSIEKKQGIDLTIAFMTGRPGGEAVDFSKMFEVHPTTCYYSTTNMGEVSSMLQGRGDHVSVKWLARCTSAEAMNTIMTHIFQTYEGKFLYGLGYSTHLMRDDIANIYVDKIINKLKIISNLQ